MRTRQIALLVLGFISFAGHTEMYSWKDASGKTHYGDHPPVGKESSAKALRTPSPPTDAENRRKAFLEKQMAERERQQKAREERLATENKSAEPEQAASRKQ